VYSHVLSAMLTLFITIAIDESFGLVRAVKTLINCGLKAENIHVNGFRNTVAVSIRGLEKLECITMVKGFAVAELGYLVKCSNDIKAVMKRLGFNPVPSEPQRIVGYKTFENFTIVIKRTSTSNTYLLIVCNTKNFVTPLPSSACVHSIKGHEDVAKLKMLGEFLTELGKSFSSP